MWQLNIHLHLDLNLNSSFVFYSFSLHLTLTKILNNRLFEYNVLGETIAIFISTHLLAAINTITATIMVPHIAALAAIVILSIFDVCEATVRTSRHC